MTYPSEQEFVEFFRTVPVLRDDVVFFRVTDPSGIALEFSFNPVDDSVQTTLSFSDERICIVSHEKLGGLSINNDTLRAAFEYEDCKVTLTLRVQPRISVEWSGLRLS